MLLHALPRESFPAGWFHSRNVCLKRNSLQTHKKGEFLHKINIHSVLMHFMFVLFSFFFVSLWYGKCNIIGWMSKNELLFNLLQYSGSHWSCSIAMFVWYKRLMIYLSRKSLLNSSHVISPVLFSIKITISDTLHQSFYRTIFHLRFQVFSNLVKQKHCFIRDFFNWLP